MDTIAFFEIALSICISLSGFSVMWGILKNKVNNNTNDIREIKDELRNINEKVIPVNVDNAKAEAKIGELTRLVETLTEQIKSLESLTQELTTEIAILKNK